MVSAGEDSGEFSRVSSRLPHLLPAAAVLDRDPVVTPGRIAVSAHLLLSDSTRLADRARKVGVEVTVEKWDRMQHDWHFTAGFVPEGREAIARIGGFVRTRI